MKKLISIVAGWTKEWGLKPKSRNLVFDVSCLILLMIPILSYAEEEEHANYAQSYKSNTSRSKNKWSTM
jgi:hypothetical protein